MVESPGQATTGLRRVGLVIGQLTVGGAEGQLAQVVRGLHGRFDPVVFSLSEGAGALREELIGYGAVVRTIGGRGLGRTRALVGALAEERIDLVHAWLFIANAYVMAARLLGARAPIITSARNCKVQGRMSQAANALAFRVSDAIVVNSSDVDAYIRRHYWAPGERIRMIQNGIDTERFRPRTTAASAAAGAIITIGRLVPQKNHDLFLRAAAELLRECPEQRFVIVGDGPLRSSLEQQAQRLGIAAQVTFAGERRDVDVLLQDASLFWLTSRWEGMPNVVLEALASGVPVIATDVGGTRELIRDGQDGFVVASEDVEGFVRHSRELLLDGRALVDVSPNGAGAGAGLLGAADDRCFVWRVRGSAATTMTMEEYPFISVIIPMRNEAGWIGACLGSILAQDYPREKLEVIVVDGESDDDSPRLLASYGEQIRVFSNPGRIVPTAMNIGIRAARGDIVARVDAHTELDPSYLREGVEALRRSGADNVGGPMISVGGGKQGDAIAAAMASRFGIGAYFHFGTEDREVDTVYMGMYPRQVFERIGLFDEELVRNQDDELNYRLRKSGGRVFMTPRMQSRYQNRQSVKALARQFFQYGEWKIRVLQKHPMQMSWRHFVPPAFVAGLVGLAVLAPWLSSAGSLLGIILAVYLTAIAAATSSVASDGDIELKLRVALAFVTMHFSWGAGFLVGLFRFGRRWFAPEPGPPQLRSSSSTGVTVD